MITASVRYLTLFSFLVLLVSLKDKLLEIAHIPYRLVLEEYCRQDNIMSDEALGATAQWIQNKFTTIYESASPDQVSDFKTHLANVFHKDVEIYQNHQPISLGTFQDDLSQANAAHARSSIEWKEVFEVPPPEGDSDTSIVAGSFIVTRSMKFRIRAAPAQRLNHNIFSAKVQRNKSGQEEDGQFLITQLFITSVQNAAPIHLPGITKTDS
ncbi:hypothetical protein CVT26_012017 [Gymnopilus dilepis]|uniref:SnoaL-like domain-containing protein n=1 Tax=Gymnopilus dilepis TaxID=231916 RepID=A0A409YHP5_9AGAR|nr:hypothetical protein CVT26_012017 [Gymnopilus dilepis]